MNPPGGSILPELIFYGLFLALLIGAGIGLRRRGRSPIVEDGPEDEPYQVYTREFDLELSAAEVLDAIPRASHDLHNGWLSKNPGLWRAWASNAAKLLQEQDAAGSDWDLRFKSAAAGLDPNEMIVVVLIDQSGSMRGEPIAAAAASAGFIAKRLQNLGIRSEVLGFSTAGWKGGRAYSKWQWGGRPKRPGRLCALMHIVYKLADEPTLSDEARDLLVHPDLLRENVDGEAILWARQRLAVRPEQYKLLLVMSDGAPVDDASLTHNGPNFLWRHLLRTLADIREETTLIFGAVGIGYDVSSLYSVSETVYAPVDVPAATSRVMVRMIAAAKEKAGFLPPRE